MFDIINDISDHVTLVQLEDSAGGVNHAVSITVSWICYSSYKIALPLISDYLDIICSLSRDEKGVYAVFKDVFY